MSKSKQEIIQILTDHKSQLTEKYGVSSIGIFGSYVREEQKVSPNRESIYLFRKPPPGLSKILTLEILTGPSAVFSVSVV